MIDRTTMPDEAAPSYVEGARPAPPALLALLEVTRPIILERYAPDCCIETAAIVMSVLSRLRIGSSPLAVRAAVFNRPAWNLFRLGSKVDDAAWRSVGAWSVGIGYAMESKPGRWNGHLVVVAKDGPTRWLIDVSLGQTSRPHRDLRVGPLLAPADPGLLAGGVQAIGMPDLVVAYEGKPGPDRDGWKSSPAWNDRPRLRPSIARVLEATRARVEEVTGA